MSLVFMDGFDHYATADIAKKWSSAPSSSYMWINPTGGRRGGGCVECGGFAGGNAITKSLSASSVSFVMGAAYYTGNLGGSNNIFVVRENTTTHLGVNLDSTGHLQVRRAASSAQVLGTSTAAVSGSSWVYIEFKFTINDTTGSFEVRLNGVNVLSATGIDTKNGGTGIIDNIQLFDSTAAKFDDFYICDLSGSSNNDFLGDCRIDTILPTSDGTYTSGVPSAGTAHYACVDENPPNTSDYISMDVVGNRDSYGFADIPLLSSSAIYGVQINPYWLKDDAGTRTAATFARSGTTNGDGAAVGLGTSAVYNPQIFPNNPATGSAWTQSAINAAEFGTTVTA
jgi:hypothetical protein